MAERLVGWGVMTGLQRQEVDDAVDSLTRTATARVNDTVEERGPRPASHRRPVKAPDRPADEHVTEEEPGRYEERHVQGRGGQARILVVHDKNLGRDVALKELVEGERGRGEDKTPSSEKDSRRASSAVVRFLREARIAGQLEHPSIVPVHELGRRQDGTLYYTMRYVRGVTLSRKLKACKSLADRLKLLGTFWNICNAVAYAHSRGVLHRDIKPGNAMVGEFGEAVLLDWGVAKVRGGKEGAPDVAPDDRLNLPDDHGDMTNTGVAVGTPAYMSPEQARGRVEDVDERSDVWGLGALLYHVLTGRPPRAGERALKDAEKEVTPVRKLCPDAPPELAAVAEKALHVAKHQRYQSAKELAAEVDAYMTGGRVRAHQYTSWELARRFAAQNKATLAGVAVALLAVLGALVAVSVALRWETTARVAESKARSDEHDQQLQANLNLAQAYQERADRQLRDHRLQGAATFAARSLLRNPAHPKSPSFTDGFAERFPESRALRVKAASTIYQARLRGAAELWSVFRADDVPNDIAYSPDGRLLAMANNTGNVDLWDVKGNRLLRAVRAHGDRCYSVAFSPDGKLLAAGARDGNIALFSTSTWTLVRRLAGHTASVKGLVFTPDGATLVSGAWDHTVRLWDPRTGTQLRVLSDHADKVNTLDVSPDGTLLATPSADHTVRVWELPGGKLLRTLQWSASEVQSVRFSPSGRLLATAGRERAVRLWDVATWKPVVTMEGHAGNVSDLAFSPDGRVLATASWDNTVRLWNVSTSMPIVALEGHDSFLSAVAFSPLGGQLASVSDDRTMRLWTMRPTRPLGTPVGHADIINTVDISPDGRRMATSGWDGALRLWDAETGSPVLTAVAHPSRVDRVAYAPDGKRIASVGVDKTVRLLDAATGAVLHVWVQPDSGNSVNWSPDGALLAVAAMDKTVRLLDARSGEPRHVLKGHTAPVAQARFSPDGKLLASAGMDRTVRLWDVGLATELAVLQGHADWAWELDWSPDGRTVASVGKDGVVVLWDVATRASRQRLLGHRGWINVVRFSPDGMLLVTGGDDHTARVWDLATGQERLLVEASHEVTDALFSRDGRTLVMADGKAVAFYPLDLGVLDIDPLSVLGPEAAATP
jgi:WD40 repeat protein/serine/threonine protein kinase